ncbi:MAG: DUF1697 domain-containing protein [Chloroflexota bacterium]
MKTKYIAFLRAINVGNRNIKMADLRTIFEALEVETVETFIASGNVIFDAPEQDTATLEATIEAHLQENLGYTVDTFIRSTAALADIAQKQPFGEITLESGGNTLYVAFLANPVSTEGQAALSAYQNEVDSFQIDGLEAYWLCRKKVGDTRFTGGTLEKAIGAPATLRNWNTVQRLTKKYPSH